MAEFKTSLQAIKLFPHGNAEKLEIAKVGQFQLVVAKSNGYRDGDLILFCPKRAVLPEDLRPHYTNSDTGASYLSGANHDRVSSIHLRGELSEGVTIPLEWALNKLGLTDVSEIPLDTDLSEKLGIKEWQIPIPTSFAGQLKRIDTLSQFKQHDVESFKLYQSEFKEGELVVATCKLHGSQINILRDNEGNRFVTSKGMAGKQLSILEDAKNVYWQAVRNTKIFDVLEDANNNIQIFGEVVPVQGGNWLYGQKEPTLRIFRVIVDGFEYNYDLIKEELERNAGSHYDRIWATILSLWVPIIYRGPFDVAKLIEASKGFEQVSGKNTHIREGIVVSPIYPRRSSEGFLLLVKILNPKFKDSDESLT